MRQADPIIFWLWFDFEFRLGKNFIKNDYNEVNLPHEIEHETYIPLLECEREHLFSKLNFTLLKMLPIAASGFIGVYIGCKRVVHVTFPKRNWTCAVQANVMLKKNKHQTIS